LVAAAILGLTIVIGLGTLLPILINYGLGYLKLSLPSPLNWLIFIATLLIWVIKSIRGIPPTEMGVLVIFNKAIKFVDSGLHFVPWLPTCLIAKFPKKLYRLDFRGRKVITKTGTYDEREYAAQEITVDSTLYFRFPRNQGLITTFESKIPTKEEELTRFWEDTVVGALRVVLGKKTWKEATEKQEEFAKEARKVIAASDQFKKTGIKEGDLLFVIEEIRLPPALTNAMILIDKQRFQAQAAPFEAKERAEETMGTVIQMIARATGKKPQEVQETIERSTKLQKEMRDFSKDLITRRMAIDGQSFVDIRVGGFPKTSKDEEEGFIAKLVDKLAEALIKVEAAKQRMPKGMKKGEKKKDLLEEVWEEVKKYKGWQ